MEMHQFLAFGFFLMVILTILLLFKASSNAKQIFITLSLIFIIQTGVSLTGFYSATDTLPPRIIFLLAPAILLILTCFVTSKGRALLDKFDAEWLTWLHTIRIPVELILYGLFINKLIPEIMTFEGRNFDILSGITAPLIAYFGIRQKKLNKNILITWNIVCLGLLFNIVRIAFLSVSYSFQQYGFEQPNLAVLMYPYILLPGLVVPVVLFSHLAAIRLLLKKK